MCVGERLPLFDLRMPDKRYVLYGMQGSGSAAIEAALDLCGATWTLVKAASWEPDANFEALTRW